MTPNQVEFVAQAFYATEHSGDWDAAPGVLQEEFRDLARVAISLLDQQTSDSRSSLTPKASEIAREVETARQQWRHSRVMTRSD
ncbi:hypothetical protein [Microvirga calopogonii]|uniref:hypothetical protein n=1 Tax=Microvirga calopogonii TaxID=2078013 RepID=UPI000E0D3B7F|nr:hypothetical protein [Microvirga calopogonii]